MRWDSETLPKLLILQRSTSRLRRMKPRVFRYREQWGGNQQGDAEQRTHAGIIAQVEARCMGACKAYIDGWIL